MIKIQQKRLAAALNILSALVPECRLMITESGWNTLAVDTANVGMVSVNLPAASFEEFKEEAAEIGMDVPKWKDMLTIMKDAESIITITRPRGMTGPLTITDGKYTYTHTPLDANTVRKRPNPPAISLPASVTIDAKEFSEAIKAMGVIGDKVRIAASGEGIAFDAEGDTDHLNKEMETTTVVKAPASPVNSLFSIDYLKEIAKGMKEAGTITVHVGHEHPVRFDFEIEGMECSYLIAPRIEQEG